MKTSFNKMQIKSLIHNNIIKLLFLYLFLDLSYNFRYFYHFCFLFVS